METVFYDTALPAWSNTFQFDRGSFVFQKNDSRNEFVNYYEIFRLVPRTFLPSKCLIIRHVLTFGTTTELAGEPFRFTIESIVVLPC
jgi:hypothetical protein